MQSAVKRGSTTATPVDIREKSGPSNPDDQICRQRAALLHPQPSIVVRLFAVEPVARSIRWRSSTNRARFLRMGFGRCQPPAANGLAGVQLRTTSCIDRSTTRSGDQPMKACIEVLNGGIRQRRGAPARRQPAYLRPRSTCRTASSPAGKRARADDGHAAGMNHGRLCGRTGSRRRGACRLGIVIQAPSFAKLTHWHPP
jgi:hypothetical protein